MRSVPVGRALLFCASLLSLAVLPATATATSTKGEIDAAIGRAVEYLRERQVPATGEPNDPESGIVFDHSTFSSDWVTIGLAAAGVNAAAVSAGGPSLQDFLSFEYGEGTGWWTSPPPFLLAEEWERVALIAHAAGLDPSRISAGLNLPAQIAGTWNQGRGSFGHYLGESSAQGSALGILTLTPTPIPAWALAPVVSHLRRLQEGDGSWTGELMSKAEITGISLAALCESGVPAYDPQVQAGLTYLREQEVEGTGAIEAGNAESTARAVSALSACGLDAQSSEWTTTAGKTPIDYLLSLQDGAGPAAGGFVYEPGESPNPYSTGDVLRAIAGGGFAVAPPPREDPSLPSVRPLPNVPAGTPVGHVLAIELNPGNVTMCKVTAPVGASLVTFLDAAKASSFPTGCVISFSATGGRIESIDGISPANADESWLLRLDRGGAAVAGQQPIGFGDVVSLRVGPSVLGPPAAAALVAPGRAGAPGAGGRRGPRGRPGRNAGIGCRAHRRHRGGRRVRCAVKHHRRSNTLHPQRLDGGTNLD